MDSQQSQIPAIVIFAFKRPEILSQTLERLSKSRRVNEFDVYLHVDFPKTENDVKENSEVLEIIESFGSIFNYKAVEIRQNHLGLRNSVISFLTVLAAAHRYIVVLEDDIIVSEDFLEYQLECLERFEFSDHIGSVSGTRYEKFRHLGTSDILLSKRHSSWGWGTWGQTLQGVNWEILEDRQRLPAIQRKVGKVGEDLNNLINLHLEGKIDSWSIIFDTNMIVSQKYSIHPRYQKIQNIGFEKGTHFTTQEILEATNSQVIEVERNQITVGVTRGIGYDFIVKLKRNSSFIATLARFTNVIRSPKIKS